jgi:hypothetical protein
MIKAGKWAVEQGCLRQSRTTYPWMGESVVLQHVYQDFDASFRMRVSAAESPNNWGGVLFHAGGRFDHHGHSGYLVFLRRNGAVGLHNRYDGTIQEVPGAVADAGQWQDIRIQMAGWRIRVWVNGAQIIDRTDANHRFAQGYTILQVLKADTCYDDVRITNKANASPVLVETTTSKHWLVADASTTYSVTLKARDLDGADEIVDVRATLSAGALAADDGRGCFAWADSDERITRGGGQWTLMGDAAGGGRWAWRSDAWGADTYVTPMSASTSTQNNDRTVTFTFSVKPAWPSGLGQQCYASIRDSVGDAVERVPASSTFGIHPFGPGDLDGDGDVDQSDFGWLQACLSAPGMPQTLLACAQARLDEDDDVDVADFAVFQACFRGPGESADPLCGN